MTLYRSTVLDTPQSPFTGGALRADQDGGILVAGGQIIARGPFTELSAQHPEEEVVDLRGGVLLPGFVDTDMTERVSAPKITPREVAVQVVEGLRPLLELPIITTPKTDFGGVLFLVAIYCLVALGLNIVVGYAGLLDLGYVAFYAVGAYATALIATHFGFSYWMCLPLAGLFAALWGLMLGFPVLRLRGDYLAIVTLAFGEIIRLVLLNWGEVTGGANGLSGVPRPTFFGIPFNASEEGFAAVFGLVALRATGVYFLMITLALGMVVWGLAHRWVTLTQGDNGISSVPRPLGLPWTLTRPMPFYYFALAGFVLAFLLLRVVQAQVGVGQLLQRNQVQDVNAAAEGADHQFPLRAHDVEIAQ